MGYVEIYPSGVACSKSGSSPLMYPFDFSNKKIVYTKDEEIIKLYRRLQNNPSLLENFEFRKQIISYAMRKYNRFKNWLKLQESNLFLHDSNLDFLKDTLNFIKTGQRQMHLGVWANIMTEYPHMSGAPRYGEFDDVNLIEGWITPVELIVQWTTQPNGLEDLLITSYLLFGKTSKG